MDIPCQEAIDEGLCHGDCCGIVRIRKEVFEATKSFMAIDVSEIKGIYLDDNDARIVTKDRRCAYMDRETYQCGIYEQRPNVCRKYGTIEELKCPYYDTEGKRRSRAGRRQAKRQLSRYVIATRNRLHQQLQRKRNEERKQ